ncbi:MAG: ImmA/IrrE family metallo-endopeptidase [Opitutaceae bacterium]|jgi:Zn-dependent peptidase ImmA (M78 family)|nr:ImmA/IrrE family metallo-endopeptidase [Opitutaceae bacterium]
MNLEEVRERTEEFRKHYLAGCFSIPVDILSLAELGLGLNIIPIDGLCQKYGIDAALCPSFDGIYIDQESYVFWEKGPAWKQNRLRFTVAHEIGHLVLHRDRAVRFRTRDEFIRHFTEPRYDVEQEANEFAGRLLVPLERLRKFYDDFADAMNASGIAFRQDDGMRERLADSVAPKFGVHRQVISTRLDRENLWFSG